MKKQPMRPYTAHIPVPMYDKAQAKAEASGLGFAAYVRTLIAKDLAESQPSK